MNNTQEDIKQYPLAKIKEIRKKEERKKKIVTFFISFICCIVAFAVGFVSGFYVCNSGRKLPDNKKISQSDAAELKAASNADGSDKKEPPKEEIKDPEVELLKELETSLVNTFKEKYPELNVSFSVCNLDNGVKNLYENVQMDGEGITDLFIAEAVFNEAVSGNYELTEERINNLTKMITENSSDAANFFIDELGGVDENGKVNTDNKIIKSLELFECSHTELNRKMYSLSSGEIPPALNNYIGVQDTVNLIKRIYSGYTADNENAKLMVDLLKESCPEYISEKINKAYPDITVTGKSGEAYGTENNVSIVLGEKCNLAIVFLTSAIPENEDATIDTEYHESVRNTIADMVFEITEKYMNMSK